MKYYSTNHTAPLASLREAVEKGLEGFANDIFEEKLEKERVAKLVKEMNKTVKKKPTKKTPKAKIKTAPRFPGR